MNPISENKSINQNAAANMISTILLNGINFFAIPLYTRLLGAANYGVVSVYNSWVYLAGVVIGLQVHGSIAQGRLHFSKDQYPGYLSSLVALSIVSFLSFSGLAVLFLNPLSNYVRKSHVLTLLILIQAFGNFGVSFASSTFIYAKQPLKTLVTSVTSVLLSLGLSVWWISVAQTDSGKVSAAIWGKAIPPILFGGLLLLYFLFKGRFVCKAEYLSFALPICLPLIIHSLSHNILSQCDRVMLQGRVTDQLVGIYSFLVTFTHLLNSIWSALNNTWVPFYYDDMKSGNTEKILQRFQNYMRLFTVLALGFLFLSPEVVRLFASREYWSGMYLLPIMCGSMYMIFLYSFPVNFQLYHRDTKMVAVGTAGAAILDIIFNMLLIPVWGMAGAAWGTFLSYVGLFLFHHLIASRSTAGTYPYPFSVFLKGILVILAGAAAFYILQDLWFIRWGTGAVLGILTLMEIIKRRTLF